MVLEFLGRGADVEARLKEVELEQGVNEEGGGGWFERGVGKG